MIGKNQIRSGADELCKKFRIKYLGVFGSIARGEESAGSDIDFFAEFEDPTPETMADRYFGFIVEAEKKFNCPVQVLTPRMVSNPFLKKSIMRDLVAVYE